MGGEGGEGKERVGRWEEREGRWEERGGQVGEEGRAGGRRGEGRWEERGEQVGGEGRAGGKRGEGSLARQPLFLRELIFQFSTCPQETRGLQRHGLLTL